ncbi:fatty acid desaturase [Zoogloea sp.]|uniref:DesA family fatty acid desaturase n=1 Tax=Zoogloea sp. TaxID=49181 RepID=UPI0026061F5E|nr:fatty acid desaturase [Zoogloea sp.]MDD3354609.1 fatty acid desaturase [Zoogloea sp.]
MFSGFFDLPWWGYVLVTLAMTHVTIAAVTIFLHRHQAHRSLDLHWLPALFYRFWLWLTTGMVTKEWAAIHRKHHAKCETADDPHSPQIHGINKVLWTGVFLYVKEARNRETIQRFGHGTPDDWFERRIFSAYPKLGIVLMLLADVAMFGVWPGVLIWGVQMVWIPFWAAGVVNGLGHFWGYRNYNCSDASTNLFPWGILIGGEELHNNHHSFATSAKLSARWYEFDIGWMYIRMLELLGLAKVKKTIPTPRFGIAKARADFDTLQAIITCRYDVMTRYLQSLKAIAREELAILKAQSGEKLSVREVRRWLVADESELRSDELTRRARLLQDNARLQTVVAMRHELMALWARSSATHDQLLQQLQDWISRAEQSGIRQLEEFSQRLRRYAV